MWIYLTCSTDSTSSAASEECHSHCETMFDQSHTAKLTHTVKQYCCLAWMNENFLKPPFGTMLDPLVQLILMDLPSISFTEAFHAKSKRFQAERQPKREAEEQPRFNSDIKYAEWNKREESPSPFYRVDDDISYRVDRVKALGNSVVPCQARKAFQMLSGIA